MEFSLGYLLLGLFIFMINMMPAFMPPTWSILAFFTIKYDLFLPIVVIIGALSALLGRVALYYLATHFSQVLPKKAKENYNDLSSYLAAHETATLPFIFAYAFSPIPSNQLFIISGLTNFNIRLLAFSFLIGRLLSYTFWVGLATTASGTIEDLFQSHLTSTTSIFIEILGFLFLIGISFIDWSKLLPKDRKSRN